MATTLAQTTNNVDVDAKRRDIVAQAEASGLRLVRFLYCDNDGIIRGKSAGVRDLHDRLETGIGLTLAMQAFTMLDHLASVEGMGPVGEIRLVPDPSTFAIAPYAPHTATVLVDMQTPDGQPYAADGRFFLKRMIARAADDHDLSLVAAFEPEWSLAIKTGDQFTPIDDSGCFTSTGMNMAAPVIDDIVAALESQGMTVEQYYAELGWGQQELSIRHAPALQAADHHIMYRETVRGIALTHGRHASFAPKPWGDQAGNGCHLHFSGSTNVELKSSDSSANPYISLAGVMAAGLDGIERQLTLPPPVTVDPHTLDESERKKIGADRLPTSLKEAIANLKTDRLLLDAMGERLATSYIAVKELDIDAFAAADEAFEFRQHIYKY